MQERNVTTYIANDGSIFYTKELCEIYEHNCALNIKDELPDLVIDCNLKNPLPLNYNSDLTIIVKYDWVKLKSKDDYDKLNKFLFKYKSNSNLYKNLYEPTKYPEILVIEKSIPNRLLPDHGWSYTGRFSYFNDFINSVKRYEEEVKKLLE